MRKYYQVMYKVGEVQGDWCVLGPDMPAATFLVYEQMHYGRITELVDIIAPNGQSVLDDFFALV